MNRSFRQFLVPFTTFLIAALLVAWVQSVERRPTRAPAHNGPPVRAGDGSANLVMGNPSGATPDLANADNFLMRKPYFALSYNNSRGVPNWVSWRLQRSDLGQAGRPPFMPDPELPRGFKHVTPNDYNGSGFDRGHMCPHSDRASTPEASAATFVMTNIIPQAPSCNQKAWADLEDYCRDLVVKKHKTLYIVSGPQGQGGAGKKGTAAFLARGKVAVPAQCWKVILVLNESTGGPDDVQRVRPDTRLIAVVMPNDERIGHAWGQYRTSVRQVEALTGYRFFDRVPAVVINPLKDKVDQEPIPAPRRHKREN